MPSLPLQTLPVAGVIKFQLPTIKGLAVLKITNLSVNIMRYRDKDNNYGDVIPPNNGSVSYHIVDKDFIPNTFWVLGTATDTFAIYYQEDK